MATEVNELYLKNKNRSKREKSSAAFSMQMEIPGGQTLVDGSHILGKLEGNVVITRVALLVKEGFTAGATATVTDNHGNTYFTTEGIDVPVVVESVLTANNALLPDPIYAEGVTEFTAVVAGLGAGNGGLILVVDYTQLDTVTGNHTK